MGALKPIYKKDAYGKKAIHSKTFLKKKYLPNKAFDKLKARLVIRGDMQFRHPWINSPKAPTVAQASVNMTIGVAAHRDDEIESIDITGAYLHADTPPDEYEIVIIGKEEAAILVAIYPELEVYLTEEGTIYMLVIKAMYGMINSARYWYENITDTLKMGGYKQNDNDECVYVYFDKNKNSSIIDLWVDDLLHVYTKNCVHFKSRLHKILINKYKNINVKDGDNVPYCGMQLERDRVNGGIYVSAPKFTSDLLSKYNVGEAEFETTPTPTSFMNEDSVEDIELKIDVTEYASLLMKIMWLARLCRNDLLFAISFMATKVKSPIQKDMKKLRHILRYINATKTIKIKYQPETLQLYAYIDASYCLHSDTKGQTGIIITLGKTGPPVFCKSKKQKLVSRSSTEAELIALNEGLPEVIWAKQFMENLGITQSMVTVYEDNTSTIILANKNNGATLSKTKHIQVRYYYVRELIEQKEINIVYLPTTEMLADLLTKPMAGWLFKTLRDKILNCRLN
jgi:hypothetical protein